MTLLFTVCTGLVVDNVAAAQKLKGCTIIQGILEIQIRGGSKLKLSSRSLSYIFFLLLLINLPNYMKRNCLFNHHYFKLGILLWYIKVEFHCILAHSLCHFFSQFHHPFSILENVHCIILNTNTYKFVYYHQGRWNFQRLTGGIFQAFLTALASAS